MSLFLTNERLVLKETVVAHCLGNETVNFGIEQDLIVQISTTKKFLAKLKFWVLALCQSKTFSQTGTYPEEAADAMQTN